eukprot:136857_1
MGSDSDVPESMQSPRKKAKRGSFSDDVSHNKASTSDKTKLYETIPFILFMRPRSRMNTFGSPPARVPFNRLVNNIISVAPIHPTSSFPLLTKQIEIPSLESPSEIESGRANIVVSATKPALVHASGSIPKHNNHPSDISPTTNIHTQNTNNISVDLGNPIQSVVVPIPSNTSSGGNNNDNTPSTNISISIKIEPMNLTISPPLNQSCDVPQNTLQSAQALSSHSTQCIPVRTTSHSQPVLGRPVSHSHSVLGRSISQSQPVLGQPVPEPQCIPRLPVSHSQCRLRDVSGCAGINHTISHSIKTEPTFESLMIDLTSSPSLSLDVQQQSSLPMMSQTSSVLSADSSPSPSPTCISGEPEPHSCIPGSSLSSQSPARPGCQPSYSLCPMRPNTSETSSQPIFYLDPEEQAEFKHNVASDNLPFYNLELEDGLRSTSSECG